MNKKTDERDEPKFTGFRKKHGSYAYLKKKEIGTITYLAPVFSPAIGGGVVYLEILSKKLLAEGACSKFIVVTETYPGMEKFESHNQGTLQIIRKFPFRAGRNKKSLASYLRYGWQNLQFFWLLLFVRRISEDILIIHGSFLNNPTTLWLVLKLIRKIRPRIYLIADLRDPKLPLEKLMKLSIFDKIISCSENISKRIEIYPEIQKKMVRIPILIDVQKPSKEFIEKTKAKYGLDKITYVFNGSGLNKEKGTKQLVCLVEEIRQQGRDRALVVVGKRRYWDQLLDKVSREGWFYYLGQVSHEEVLALSAGSWLDINLSKVDSMPRHSLEALSVGAKVILPKGIPEFERDCPYNIARSTNLDELAERVIKIAEGINPQCEYSIDQHLPGKVIPKYLSLFRIDA